MFVGVTSGGSNYCFVNTNTEAALPAFGASDRSVSVNVFPSADSTNSLRSVSLPFRLIVICIVRSPVRRTAFIVPVITPGPVLGAGFPSRVAVKLCPSAVVYLIPLAPARSILRSAGVVLLTDCAFQPD